MMNSDNDYNKDDNNDDANEILVFERELYQQGDY